MFITCWYIHLFVSLFSSLFVVFCVCVYVCMCASGVYGSGSDCDCATATAVAAAIYLSAVHLVAVFSCDFR